MKNISLIIIYLLGFCQLAFSQIVTIGKQEWMKENLNVDKFRNGDPIPQAKTVSEWLKAGKNGQPAWCYYNNDPANGAKYAKLYNWYAVNDPRGLAPIGWRIPSDDDWGALTKYLGGSDNASIKIKTTFAWQRANGTNESGFSGLPGGFRSDSGSFENIGKSARWWSSTETNKDFEGFILIQTSSRDLDFNDVDVYNAGNSGKGRGMSVRCLRDENIQ